MTASAELPKEWATTIAWAIESSRAGSVDGAELRQLLEAAERSLLLRLVSDDDVPLPPREIVKALAAYTDMLDHPLEANEAEEIERLLKSETAMLWLEAARSR